MLPVISNSRRHLKGVGSALIAAAIAISWASAPASAQDAGGTPPAAPAVQAPSSGQKLGSWIKLCAPDQANESKEDVCLVTQEVRTETGEFLASVSVQETKTAEGKRLVRAAVPLGTLIQPGIRMQIDEGKQVAGKYVICLPNACYAEMEIDDAFIESLKKGTNLVVLVINNQGKAVGIGLTLMGFTKTWDGPPVPMEELAQQRQKLQEELQKRAEEARKKMIDQGGTVPQPAEGATE
ncbi:invasion associated locus B family protein [Microbaculum marinisediminis]|uniref:Invasion associated locus B family protein n=1 Tax=Microbaculum marinisediminis TaxID=2931392 RepID=A0AAW5R635_9HYPH|nr:invasion associated locus B family protein [Microbaculum sp. A6E488]MCT8974089.1 invasion associated locus B family protein [Microbaculum sp. A6E488]